MQLETDRLVLQELSWSDLDNIHAFHSIPDVAKFNTIGIPKDIGITKNIIKGAIEDQSNNPRSVYGWIVRLKHDNSFIGETGMSSSNDRFKRGEIHYHLSPVFWKQGFGTEIAQRLIKFGFEDLHLHRIEAGVATNNIGSIRVLEKSGMIREGLRRGILPIRGKWCDNYMYAILEGDYIQK
ncbi:GNAT family N-acetyltransferase [Roseivirga sp.]|uniref:GNAT family N-acetyltransferase n=1 Tax=Roseivirga sp. TaxID=1964215 RepID=UPI003B8B159A